ncbi:SgcJ/EcaC family oxidoreductase [Nocardia sp. CNY236]|uniref:SgcJ/EcaC family oxidoreductase n=1 Tax=Nocardia sp. CNY236 TaxID=1169152 RepID=UPI0004084316|nr:SgcJ/EcaC family oxidoreductase [Nocardia sp. CNY236]
MTTVSDPAVIPQRIMDAWKNNDAAGFASVFTEDGTMILPGVHQKGRNAIAAFMTEAFAGPYAGTQVIGTPFDVKTLTDDVVILFTQGGIRPTTADSLPDGAWVRATWVLVRDGDSWSLASYTNAPY